MRSVRIAKRAIDIAASTVGLALTVPLYPVIAAAIYADSPGPIFYKQRRAGRLIGMDEARQYRFVEFDMFKFRTMRTDAEKHTGAVLAAEGDPRVTRVGRFLRKTRIDELPQLFNVLFGSMSLVGPRPERPQLINDLAYAIPMFEERMRDVKPGITGLAQISLNYSGAAGEDSPINQFKDILSNPFGIAEAEGATADDMRLKLLYDLAYTASLEHFRAWLAMELDIIVKTPLIMIRGAGR